MSFGVFDVPLTSLDECFEGGVPATLCSCARDGTPNITFLSVVHRVDDEHIALSYQFFRKTKQNLAENPQARLLVIEPRTAAEYRLSIAFVRTETAGPVFARLATSVSAVASQTGMHESRLLGAQIYRVTSCERYENGIEADLPRASLDCLAQLARYTASLSECLELDVLLQRALSGLDSFLGYSHSFLLAADEQARTLFSVGSHGYSPSGIGAEIAMGRGLIGMAAERRTCVRVASMSRERTFADAVHNHDDGVEGRRSVTTIPLPGLTGAESQLAMPLLARGELLGVLCLQSARTAAFTRVDEQIVSVVADHIASGMARMRDVSHDVASPSEDTDTTSSEPPAVIHRHAEDDSVFIDNEYLIRGVAGRVLWVLLQAHQRHGRHAFTNRELRADPWLGLPPLKDNLETRLITLRKRLEEKCPFLHMESTGRGRFELRVARPIHLLES